MGDWSINYYRKELESASGMRWMPAPPTLTIALRQVATARQVIKMIRSTQRVLTLALYLSIASVLTGVAAGVFEVFRTNGPTVAFIVPGCFLALGSGWLRFWFAVSIASKYEDRLSAAEAAYQVALEKSINS